MNQKSLLNAFVTFPFSYAAPEMLSGKKYMGTGISTILSYTGHLTTSAEVDIWSLGIIFYCLLIGTLPFDDDDENVMREKIIAGEYEIPEWVNSGEASFDGR